VFGLIGVSLNFVYTDWHKPKIKFHNSYCRLTMPSFIAACYAD